jgi:hypothetical protein
MTTLDWVVLVGAIGLIVAYGAWKTREVKTVDVYLRGGSDLRWWTIGLSIMATQASAITFLSMPGQAYQDGMGFIQFYLGLPVAMVILSAIIVPIYYRLKVYTAYEYLETRFDRKTRQLVALLFLLSRGLGAGISLYAPAIVLSTLLGWPLGWTTLILGAGVIAYTVSGGTRVVSRTQTWQMVIMLGGMAAAFAFVLHRLPPSVSFDDALGIGGVLGKMKVVDFSPRVDTRYTLWSGLTGGLFVQLAYFGTDQSQVQRYLSGSPLAESRLGLMFNGLVKVPMQFGILMVGVLLVVFYQFHRPPIFFNQVELARAEASARGDEIKGLEQQWDAAWVGRERTLAALLDARHAGDAARAEAAAAIQAAKVSEFHGLGIVLGYGYAESRAVVDDGTPPPEEDVVTYRPSPKPGYRLPHAWLGSASLYDRLGDGFTLLRIGDGDPGELAAAAAERGLPFTQVDLREAGLLERFRAPLVLVRPDQHVAWKGAPPADPGSVLDTIRGRP